jgi:mannose/fructose/N-acetylgalactosamine-specific phosphotransferase system component IIC
MALLPGLLIVGAVVALAQAERKGVLQAMISRPLVLGGLLGWALGDVTSGLLLAVPLELLWLGGINVGANLPDHEVAGTGAVVGGAILAAGGEPMSYELATLALVVVAPLATVGRRLDGRIEKGNVALIGRTRARLDEGRASGSLNLAGLLLPSLSAAGVAVAGALLLALVLPLAVGALPAPARGGLAFAFPMIAAVCAAAGVASIRSARAPLFATAALGVGALVLLTVSAIGAGP